MKKYNFNNNVEKDIKNLESLSQQELMQKLIESAKLGKKDNSINDQKLENFFNNAKAFLNSEEQDNLRKLIDIVKNA